MIAIAIIGIVLLALALAKHGHRRGGRRTFGRYMRGNLEEVFPLGTLAPKTLSALAVTGAVTERTLVSSIVATWTLSSWTPVADAGPIVFGVAHSDYTAAEIESWLEDQGAWNEGNKISQEVSRRKIRRIGVLDTPDLVTDAWVFNDGRPKKTKLNWILNTGQTLDLWAYNTGGAAVSGASGADIHVTGHANLWPR